MVTEALNFFFFLKCCFAQFRRDQVKVLCDPKVQGQDCACFTTFNFLAHIQRK